MHAPGTYPGVPMRHYYTADAIRAAEAPLLASLPDGVLMARRPRWPTAAV